MGVYAALLKAKRLLKRKASPIIAVIENNKMTSDIVLVGLTFTPKHLLVCDFAGKKVVDLLIIL